MLLLYNPPSNARRKPHLPMSLLSLGAVLEGQHDYRIVDGNLEPDSLGALDRAVRETGADILGVTVMPGFQLDDAVPLARRLKELHPRLTMIWGGYFPTQHYDACLQSPSVDYVVRGHGELVFKELVDALRAGGDPATIQGVAFRDADGEIQANGRADIPHPEQLPDFPYHSVPVERYARPTFMGARTLPHHSSYGCPFLCNFCAVVNMVDGRWKAQSAERTAKVAVRLADEFKVDAVEFCDNNFFVRESRTAEFAERVMDRGIAWWGEARIDTLMAYRTHTWELMKKAGLKMVFLGAESGSDATLARMNKGGQASASKTLELAEKAKAYEVVPEFSFIVGNPPDPEGDARQTIEFIRKVKRINPASEIILYMYTPVPLDGELFEEARCSGFRFPETLEEWVSPKWKEFSLRRSAHVPWVRDPLRQEVRDFEWVLNARYPTTTDIHLGRVWRAILKATAGWRYGLRVYRYPLELRALQKLVSYRRPETSGF
jgi:radical SAM superfamily enzyme YgiQ (UPF0313 family)